LKFANRGGKVKDREDFYLGTLNRSKQEQFESVSSFANSEVKGSQKHAQNADYVPSINPKMGLHFSLQAG